MPRVSVHASDEYDEEPVNDAEASFDDGVDIGVEFGVEFDSAPKATPNSVFYF